MDDTLTLAQQLMAIPSTADNPDALHAVLDLAQNELKGTSSKEFASDGIESLVFYNSMSIPKRFRLLLNAHLDVVPAKAEQYKPMIKADKLYGRGAYDMKAAAAVMIKVFTELSQQVDYSLGLQLVTDEEIGGFHGTKYQISQGVNADFVIAGENTDLLINNESKGIIWLKITTRGTAAHGAYPWLGDNAILKMNREIASIIKAFPILKEEAWKTTINIGRIETSNTAFNKVPDDCTVSADVRFISQDKDTIVAAIRKNLAKDTDLEIIVQEPAHYTSPQNVDISLLQESNKRVMGKQSELVAKHGASDIRHFNLVGSDGITFGPTGEGHHSDYEWVSIESLENYYKILHQYLLRIDDL